MYLPRVSGKGRGRLKKMTRNKRQNDLKQGKMVKIEDIFVGKRYEYGKGEREREEEEISVQYHGKNAENKSHRMVKKAMASHNNHLPQGKPKKKTEKKERGS